MARVSTVETVDALTCTHSTARTERIALVLTCHPTNTTVINSILNHFKILQDDPETTSLLKEPPLISNKKERLVRNELKDQANRSCSTLACNHSRWSTCIKDNVLITHHSSCTTSCLLSFL